MYQLHRARQRADGEKCPQKLQTAQALRNELFVVCHAGEHRAVLFIRVQNPLLRLGLRILLIPVIAGISYELIRLAGRSDNFLVRIISAPGMWLQRLTTKEPDDSMIEVAIASVEAVFDWKAYLKETFGYDVEDWEKQDAAAKAQEAEDAEAADGMEAGKAAAEESREQ